LTLALPGVATSDRGADATVAANSDSCPASSTGNSVVVVATADGGCVVEGAFAAGCGVVGAASVTADATPASVDGGDVAGGIVVVVGGIVVVDTASTGSVEGGAPSPLSAWTALVAPTDIATEVATTTAARARWTRILRFMECCFRESWGGVITNWAPAFPVSGNIDAQFSAESPGGHWNTPADWEQ
jgi:hypothetical protein